MKLPMWSRRREMGGMKKMRSEQIEELVRDFFSIWSDVSEYLSNSLIVDLFTPKAESDS